MPIPTSFTRAHAETKTLENLQPTVSCAAFTTCITCSKKKKTTQPPKTTSRASILFISLYRVYLFHSLFHIPLSIEWIGWDFCWHNKVPPRGKCPLYITIPQIGPFEGSWGTPEQIANQKSSIYSFIESNHPTPSIYHPGQLEAWSCALVVLES